MSPSARAIGAVWLSGLFALVSAGWYYREAGALASENRPETAALYQQRYAPLRQALPPSGRAGYVTDLPEGLAADTEFALLQYTVAPVVVERRADLPTVIGNFHTTEPLPQIMRERGLTLARNLGQGVLLFRK